MATLKCPRSRSLRLRNTCLLSFRDCASAMCSSRVSSPTGMNSSGGCAAILPSRGHRHGALGGLRGAHFDRLKALQHITNFHVIEIGDSCAAFKTGAYFANVLFKALKGGNL